MDEFQQQGWFWALIAGAAALGAAVREPVALIFRWVAGMREREEEQTKNLKDHEEEVEAKLSFIRQALADHKDKNALHLGVVEARIAENYSEFLRFQTEVAKELATKEDLRDTEARIKDHITKVAKNGH